MVVGMYEGGGGVEVIRSGRCGECALMSLEMLGMSQNPISVGSMISKVSAMSMLTLKARNSSVKSHTYHHPCPPGERGGGVAQVLEKR